MNKIILDKNSYINKNNEVVFVYTLVKPRYDRVNKKFDGVEFFNVKSKIEYQLLDVVKIQYNQQTRYYEIVSE
jgi:hypothetical protein